MSALYVLGGIVLLAFGIWQTTRTLKVYNQGEEDKLGADIKMLGAGIGAIIGGVIIIVQHI